MTAFRRRLPVCAFAITLCVIGLDVALFGSSGLQKLSWITGILGLAVTVIALFMTAGRTSSGGEQGAPSASGPAQGDPAAGTPGPRPPNNDAAITNVTNSTIKIVQRGGHPPSRTAVLLAATIMPVTSVMAYLGLGHMEGRDTSEPPPGATQHPAQILTSSSNPAPAPAISGKSPSAPSTGRERPGPARSARPTRSTNAPVLPPSPEMIYCKREINVSKGGRDLDNFCPPDPSFEELVYTPGKGISTSPRINLPWRRVPNSAALSQSACTRALNSGSTPASDYMATSPGESFCLTTNQSRTAYVRVLKMGGEQALVSVTVWKLHKNDAPSAH